MRVLSTEPDLTVLDRLRRFETLALTAVSVVAGGVLGLWCFPSLAAYVPFDWSKMTALAAIAMLLSAVSLALSSPGRSRYPVGLSQAAAFAVFAIGAVVLWAYGTGFDLAIARWLPVDPAARNLGRPSPQTALGFVLIGICLMFIRKAKSRLSLGADICAIGLVCLVLFLLGGHVFGTIALVGMNRSNLTSPQTLFCLFLLAFVIAARRSVDGKLLSVVVSRGAGGRAIRVVLPGIAILPFVWLGLIGYAATHNVMSAAYGAAIGAPIMTLTAFAIIALLAIRTNELEGELRLQSLMDQLTEVLNRRGFYAVAQHAMRNASRAGTELVLFYFDLDGLKHVNDRLGHEVGSNLIQQFARILTTTFRGSDVVARIGGDEFVVLATTSHGSAVDILARLKNRVAAANAMSPGHGDVMYSAGYVELTPDSTATIDELLGRADAKMYEEKQKKRGLGAAPGLELPH